MKMTKHTMSKLPPGLKMRGGVWHLRIGIPDNIATPIRPLVAASHSHRAPGGLRPQSEGYRARMESLEPRKA